MIDPTINDYLKGKIYKLVSQHTNKIYIGSTKKNLLERLSSHKSKFKQKDGSTTANSILIYDDVKIELIENYPTTSKYFLEIREGFWIENLECVNKIIPRYQENININKYENGKIYKLISINTNKIYIGSTTKSLKIRLSRHYSDYNTNRNITSTELFNSGEVIIELIEDFPTTSKYLLEVKERYWIERLDCVNKIIPTRTKKEYYNENKEKYLNYQNNYRQENKIQVKEANNKRYINCKEKYLNYSKEYNQNNKVKIRERQKQYSINNKETIKKINNYII